MGGRWTWCEAAAERAAGPLAEAVLPYAQQVIAEHRAQERVAGDGHDDPRGPDPAAGRGAGLRRRHRHPLRTPSRPLRRDHLGRVRLGQGEGPLGRRMGNSGVASTSTAATPIPTATTTPRCCHSWATRVQSIQTRACWRCDAPTVARGPLRCARRACPSSPGSSRSGCSSCSPSRSSSRGCASTSRAPSTSPDMARRCWSRTIAPTSIPSPSACSLAQVVARSVPRQEGGLRRPHRRRPGRRARRHPGRPGLRVRRTAPSCTGRARRRRAGRDHAAGHHPARPGVLRSRAEGPLGCGEARGGGGTFR